ncbi:MAG: UvrB/UvrC motif-containing protein [Candidatus Omnitrophica bacterium]|nr:UvrB/UvrC motif-containing protein [Candidatus Omnitrophota bacterium]
MRCEKCEKSEATVHLTEILNGNVHEFHLCEDCAKVKSAEVEQNFGLADLLAGLSVQGKPQAPVLLTCKNCGLSYEDFRKTGRLGCNECYQSFKSELSVLLKRIHGSAEHHGKKPIMIHQDPILFSAVIELDKVKDELKEAILKEQFEKAAELRDKIKSLEKGA